MVFFQTFPLDLIYYKSLIYRLKVCNQIQNSYAQSKHFLYGYQNAFKYIGNFIAIHTCSELSCTALANQKAADLGDSTQQMMQGMMCCQSRAECGLCLVHQSKLFPEKRKKGKSMKYPFIKHTSNQSIFKIFKYADHQYKSKKLRQS